MTWIARRLLLSVSAIAAIAASRGVAQPGVPMRILTTSAATTSIPFGSIDGVRALANGEVLVNDSRNRQLVALDSNFVVMTTMLDSAPAVVHYGPGGARLVPYLADSTFFLGATSQFLFVIDPLGNVAHRFMKTPPGQAPMSISAPRGFDSDGNAIMTGPPAFIRAASGRLMPSDEQDIIRANFSTRQYDEVASVKVAVSETVQMSGEVGRQRLKRTFNPLVLADDWTVLSNGTVAVVRARDYRVDLIEPSGRKLSSTRIQFDKRRLSSDDKQKIVDSVSAKISSEDKTTSVKLSKAVLAAFDSIRKISSRQLSRSNGASFTLQLLDEPGQVPDADVAFVPFKEMLDYYPPFLAGAAKADLDANLWILTTAVGLGPGETIYDVVNSRGALFQRVRVPAGRTIAGFGHDGIVYLKVKREANQWALERVRIAN